VKKPVFTPRARLTATILLTLTVPPFAFATIVDSVDGGLRGPALFLLTPFLALGGLVLAISAWRAFPASRLVRATLIVTALLNLPSGVLSTLMILQWEPVFPVYALVPGKPAAPFQQTRIILRSHGKSFVISDPSNRLKFRYGSPPASVEIHDGLRTVIFDQPVQLKSWTDCVALEENQVMLGGWMGAGLSATEGPDVSVIVGPDGHINSWGGI